jgi:hypothetical protein
MENKFERIIENLEEEETYSTKELTSKAISEGFIVYEKLCL